MNLRQLYEIIDSYSKAEILYTAHDLKIFEILAKEKELTVEKLAEKANADKDSLDRTLSMFSR